jgi:hypothetical protein
MLLQLLPLDVAGISAELMDVLLYPRISLLNGLHLLTPHFRVVDFHQVLLLKVNHGLSFLQNFFFVAVS